MSRVYDTLMKSAKFTAVQNKAESGEFMESISELVLLCEKEGGFIPRFYTDSPKDKVDMTIRDMQGYNRSLIENETNLSDLIEGAVKALQRQAEIEEDEDVDDDELDLEEIVKQDMTDEDFEEYYGFLEEQEEIDKALFEEE